jgi:hypothetical protein
MYAPSVRLVRLRVTLLDYLRLGTALTGDDTPTHSDAAQVLTRVLTNEQT